VYVLGWLIVLVFAVPATLRAILMSDRGRAMVEPIGLRLPMIGGVLRRNLVARWCDALRLGVVSGMNLPTAIALAGDAVHSPTLARDGARMCETIESGRSVSDVEKLAAIPPTVPAAMELAVTQANLEGTLASLAQMYQQEADWRLGAISAMLPPALLIALGSVLGLIVIALFLPLVKLVTELT